jgi:hypothetical protein
MPDFIVVWQRVALTGLTSDCTMLRGSNEVLCDFVKLTVGELVKNLHNFAESKNNRVQQTDFFVAYR